MPSFIVVAAEACREAYAAARGNALRTALAALATTAAVATIVVVVTGLEAIETYARDTSARTVGSDTFVIAQVVAGQLSRRELAERLTRNPVIRAADYRFLDRLAGADVVYAPVTQRAGDIVAGGRRFEAAALNGTSHTLASVRTIDIDDGRFIGASEFQRAAPVVVIGADIAAELFPAADAVGEAVRIAGTRFEVIGVVRRQGSAGGVTLDRYAYLPLGAFERVVGPAGSLQILARPPAGGDPQEAEGRATISMRARRQLRPGAADTFDVLTPDAARSFVMRLTSEIGTAAVPISLMALITATVVVANTVLVSVSQRIREIGVRRAVGASRLQITSEVLAESILTALLGGLAGVAAALGVLAIGSRLAGFVVGPTWQTIGSALAAAAVTGIIAGYFPARRAAGIDVIAALRLD